MITFPFELGDTWNLSLFVTAIVPGGSNASLALSGSRPVPTDGILQENGFFILQENGDVILQEA